MSLARNSAVPVTHAQPLCCSSPCSHPEDPHSLFTLVHGPAAMVVGEKRDPQLAALLQAATRRAQRERPSYGQLPPVCEQQHQQQPARPPLPVWRHVRDILEETSEAAAAAAAVAAGLPRASNTDRAAPSLRMPVSGSQGSSRSASPGPGQAAAAATARNLLASLAGADAGGGRGASSALGGRSIRSRQGPGSGGGSAGASGANSTEPCGAGTGSVRLAELHPGDSFSGRWVRWCPFLMTACHSMCARVPLWHLPGDGTCQLSYTSYQSLLHFQQHRRAGACTVVAAVQPSNSRQADKNRPRPVTHWHVHMSSTAVLCSARSQLDCRKEAGLGDDWEMEQPPQALAAVCDSNSLSKAYLLVLGRDIYKQVMCSQPQSACVPSS